MAKKLSRSPLLQGETLAEELLTEPDRAIREYDLVDDIVFDPPLPPAELRRRYGIGISWEERLKQAQRQIAEGLDDL